ncbi:hypothetical protein MPH_00509 [Macrophomina phaseolina MS6]|uniref:Uncharacterized protein n=1 Tax=Macrophomina phaseolina (strain MS6) TaxID=1126212 RepID=K2RHW2_MACPH|nr:hypothetical protein MPH_00509 [Macrophomina phaseolina MS6]
MAALCLTWKKDSPSSTSLTRSSDLVKDAWLLGLLKKYSENNFEPAAVPDITCEGAFDDAVKGFSAVIHVASLRNLHPDPEGEDLTTIKPRDRAESILKELGRPGWKSLEDSVKGELGKNSTQGHAIQCTLQIVPLDAFRLGGTIGSAAMDFVDFRYWEIRLPADEAHCRQLRFVTLAPDDPLWGYFDYSGRQFAV